MSTNFDHTACILLQNASSVNKCAEQKKVNCIYAKTVMCVQQPKTPDTLVFPFYLS